MKALGWLVGIVTLILGGAYTLAFTPVGNSFIQPALEQKINEASELNT